MSTTLVSLQEYLDTSYSPDREYVDGVIVERYVGKFPHSLVQSNFIFSLRLRNPALWALPEQRMQTKAHSVRVPDVCVVLERPAKDVLEEPPFICVEILSPDDTTIDLLEKLEEYVAMEVPHIWVVDPRRKKAFTYSSGRLEEVRTELRGGADISIPQSEVFARL